MIRRLLASAALAVVATASIALPAHADGWQYVSLKTNGGSFQGEAYTDSGSWEFRVTGWVTDSTSVSRCTYVLVEDGFGYDVFKKTVCGTAAKIDTGLEYNRKDDDFYVSVCREIAYWPDDCSKKRIYFT